jgi:hypothetical protein
MRPRGDVIVAGLSRFLVAPSAASLESPDRSKHKRRPKGGRIEKTMQKRSGTVNSGRAPQRCQIDSPDCGIEALSGEKTISDSATLVAESSHLVWSASSDTTSRAASPVSSVPSVAVSVLRRALPISDSAMIFSYASPGYGEA